MSRGVLVCMVSLMIACTMAFAQIQITSESFPSNGQSWTHHEVYSVSVGPGSGGANQTWTLSDFGGWTTSDEAFVAPSSTPYGSSFPTATNALTADAVSWSYYRLASNGLYYQGMAGNVDGTDTLIVLNPEANFIPLPVNYNSQWSTVWHTQWDYEIMPDSFITVYFTDSTRNHADGWGTLNTPFGNWSVLRVQQHNFFTMSIPPFYQETTEAYRYEFASNSGFQGANVSQEGGADPNPNFTTGDVDIRTWNPTSVDPVRGPVADQFSMGQNYPNPFNPGTMLPVELQRDMRITLDVYDETGRLVSTEEMQLSAGSHQIAIDGSKWATGTYFARVIAGSQAVTRKMQLVK